MFHEVFPGSARLPQCAPLLFSLSRRRWEERLLLESITDSFSLNMT